MKNRLRTAAEVNPEELNSFLMRFFPAGKCLFLREHGDWLHGGIQNRWVLLQDDRIAGYCAVIPTMILSGNETLPAIWWMDLIIAPEFRGQGLQVLFDKKIQEQDLLKIGFPNLLAARIHKKHNWGVRADLWVMLLPLQPLQVHQVRAATGWRGSLLRLAAAGLSPVMGLYKIIVDRTRGWGRIYKGTGDPARGSRAGRSTGKGRIEAGKDRSCV